MDQEEKQAEKMVVAYIGGGYPAAEIVFPVVESEEEMFVPGWPEYDKEKILEHERIRKEEELIGGFTFIRLPKPIPYKEGFLLVANVRCSAYQDEEYWANMNTKDESDKTTVYELVWVKPWKRINYDKADTDTITEK